MSKIQSKKLLKMLATATLGMVAGMSAVGAGCNKPADNAGDSHTHTYADEYTKTASGHYKAATCEHLDLKIDEGEHADNNSDGLCDVCQYEVSKPHEHATTSTEWQSDANKHWKVCSANDGGRVDEGNHTSPDAEGKCTVCKRTIGAASGGNEHTHAAAADAEWQKDATNHWKDCSLSDGGKVGEEAHADADSNGKCDTCGYDLPRAVNHDFAYVSALNKTLVSVPSTAVADEKLPQATGFETAGIFMRGDGNYVGGYTEEYVKYVADTDGKMILQQVGTGATGKPNISTEIVLGLTTGKIEGCFEDAISETSTGQQHIRFLDADGKVVLQIGEKVGKGVSGNPYYQVTGGEEVVISGVTIAQTVFNKYYFCYDDGKLTVEIDGKVAVNAVAVDRIACVRLISSNKGGRKHTVKNVVVAATAMTFGEKADLKITALQAKRDALKAKTVSDVDTTLAYDEAELAELDAKCAEGVTAITALKTQEGATVDDLATAYNTAITNLNAVKTKAQKQAAADEAELAAAKTTAIEAVNGVAVPDGVTLTEANIASVQALKDDGIAKINAVTISATMDKAAALAKVEDEKTAAVAAVTNFYEDLKKTVAEVAAENKTELESYLAGKITAATNEEARAYTADEKTAVSTALNSALASELATQKGTLDTAATHDELATKFEAAKTALDTALATKFNEDCVVTVKDFNQTIKVKFGAKFKKDKVHVTAMNVTAVKYNGTAISDDGLLVLGATEVSAEIADIENFATTATYEPAATTTAADRIAATDLVVVDNAQFKLTVPDGTLRCSKGVAVEAGTTTKTLVDVVVNSTNYSDALSCSVKAQENNSANPYVFEIKESLSSLKVYLRLAETTGDKTRTGNMFYKINGGTPVKVEGSDNIVTVPDVKFGDKVEIYAENTEVKNGGKLFLVKAEGLLDDTAAPKTVNVTWKNQDGTEWKSEKYLYYKPFTAPDGNPTLNANHSLTGWKLEGTEDSDKKEVNENWTLASGSYVMVPVTQEASNKVTFIIKGVSTEVPITLNTAVSAPAVTTADNERFIDWKRESGTRVTDEEFNKGFTKDETFTADIQTAHYAITYNYGSETATDYLFIEGSKLVDKSGAEKGIRGDAGVTLEANKIFGGWEYTDNGTVKQLTLSTAGSDVTCTVTPKQIGFKYHITYVLDKNDTSKNVEQYLYVLNDKFVEKDSTGAIKDVTKLRGGEGVTLAADKDFGGWGTVSESQPGSYDEFKFTDLSKSGEEGAVITLYAIETDKGAVRTWKLDFSKSEAVDAAAAKTISNGGSVKADENGKVVQCSASDPNATLVAVDKCSLKKEGQLSITAAGGSFTITVTAGCKLIIFCKSNSTGRSFTVTGEGVDETCSYAKSNTTSTIVLPSAGTYTVTAVGGEIKINTIEIAE